MSKEKYPERFQYQPWYIKLYRYRYYLLVPTLSFKMWVKAKTIKLEDDEDYRATLKECFRLAIGLQQVKMKWLYDWEDVRERIFKH